MVAKSEYWMCLPPSWQLGGNSVRHTSNLYHITEFVRDYALVSKLAMVCAKLEHRLGSNFLRLSFSLAGSHTIAIIRTLKAASSLVIHMTKQRTNPRYLSDMVDHSEFSGRPHRPNNPSISHLVIRCVSH